MIVTADAQERKHNKKLDRWNSKGKRTREAEIENSGDYKEAML